MKAEREAQSKISLYLFIDDSDDSKQAFEALKKTGEQFQVYHISSLRMNTGDEIEAPTLYAPEGIFHGWKQILTFVGIPSDMRYGSVIT